jgi:hypothetical protein
MVQCFLNIDAHRAGRFAFLDQSRLAPSDRAPSPISIVAATLGRERDAGHTNSWQDRRHLKPASKAEREFGVDRLVMETLTAYRAVGWRGT